MCLAEMPWMVARWRDRAVRRPDFAFGSRRGQRGAA